MIINYLCDNCGEAIDSIEVENVDENRLGFDCLTDEERHDLIHFDASSGSLQVRSLCDACIEALGLTEESRTAILNSYLN
jgi:hypothetical protein